MNVHLIQHLVQTVRNHGPLQAQSAFHYEDFNGYLANFVKGNTDVLLEISNKYLLKKSLQQTKVADSSEDKLLGKPEKIALTEKAAAAIKQKNIFLAQDRWIYMYKRCMKSQRTYTSESYTRAKTTVDYFAMFSSNVLGKVRFYFKINESTYALVTPFKISTMIDHLWEVEEEPQDIVIETNKLVDKLIYMKILGRNWIVIEPNEFERD